MEQPAPAPTPPPNDPDPRGKRIRDARETLRRLSPENFRQAQIEADKRAAERAAARKAADQVK